MQPSLGSQNRMNSLQSVDLPEPLLPARCTIEPGVTSRDTSLSTGLPPYEKSMSSAAAPENESTLQPSKTSRVCGCSSSRSRTRAPLASVCCKPLPRFATAIIGPNEDIRAATHTNACPKSMTPCAQSAQESATMATSSARTSPFVAAMLLAARPFRRCSTFESESMRASSCSARACSWPNCSVSRRPRKLSSTNEFMPPRASRRSLPPFPAARDATHGATTPTKMYATNAPMASCQQTLPMKAIITAQTNTAMSTGERVCA